MNHIDGNYWLQEDDPRDILSCFDQDIPSRDGAHRVELCRSIVEAHSAQLVDGTIVDVQSANAIITVHDGLNPANQAKFATRSIVRMGQLAWDIVARVQSRRLKG